MRLVDHEVPLEIDVLGPTRAHRREAGGQAIRAPAQERPGEERAERAFEQEHPIADGRARRDEPAAGRREQEREPGDDRERDAALEHP